MNIDLKQKLFEKLRGVISSEFSKIGVYYIEHGESFIVSETEFKGLKVEIKIEVKKATEKECKSIKKSI
jgi:hypothetical protein